MTSPTHQDSLLGTSEPFNIAINSRTTPDQKLEAHCLQPSDLTIHAHPASLSLLFTGLTKGVPPYILHSHVPPQTPERNSTDSG